MILDPKQFYAFSAAMASGLAQIDAPLCGPTERHPPGAPSALLSDPAILGTEDRAQEARGVTENPVFRETSSVPISLILTDGMRGCR
jgi:hypothetical protein